MTALLTSALAGGAIIACGIGVPGVAAQPGGGRGGHPEVASGTMDRSGIPAGMPAHTGPGGAQSWVLELAWKDCTPRQAGGATRWNPSAPPRQLSATCLKSIDDAVAAAASYNASVYKPGSANPDIAYKSRVKVRLRAGLLAPDTITGVKRIGFACPAEGAMSTGAATMPEWWDPTYALAYQQWLGLLNSAFYRAEKLHKTSDVISDVTLSGPMTCFAEPMMRHPELKVGSGPTNGERLVKAYKQWKPTVGTKPATFYEADLRAWKTFIDIHARTLTVAPTSLTMNPFQQVKQNGKVQAVWNPILPGRIGLLDYAERPNVLGPKRLVLENNSVGLGDIPRSCATVVKGNDLTGGIRTLYDAMYCRMRADAPRFATHYQMEIAQKIHKDLWARGKAAGNSTEPSVSDNTAAVCEIVDDIAQKQKGLTAELPRPLQKTSKDHYDPSAACLGGPRTSASGKSADQRLEQNALAFVKGRLR